MNRPKRPQKCGTSKFSCRLPVLFLFLAALGPLFSGNAQAADLILEGFDLFETAPGATFFFDAPVPNTQFVDFEGNPIGTFDFGDGNGAVNVGTTDTIVERLQLADLSSGSDTIDIEIVALSLVSIAPVDLGFGAGFEDLFIDLNTSSPSIQSTMTIFDTGEGDPHGTFNSTLNFSFDVTGSEGGFYTTIEKIFTASGADWQHAPIGPIVIDGINHDLNTVDETNDFWPSGIVIHDDGGGAIHPVTPPTPEPSTLTLVALGSLLLSGRRKRVVD